MLFCTPHSFQGPAGSCIGALWMHLLCEAVWIARFTLKMLFGPFIAHFDTMGVLGGNESTTSSLSLDTLGGGCGGSSCLWYRCLALLFMTVVSLYLAVSRPHLPPTTLPPSLAFSSCCGCVTVSAGSLLHKQMLLPQDLTCAEPEMLVMVIAAGTSCYTGALGDGWEW